MARETVAGTVGQLAGMIARSRRLVVFTGAGISTESGIPDFRSPGGIWEKYTPVEHHEFMVSESARRRYWERSKATYPVVHAALPNAAHLALVRLYGLGRLDCVITQNIDGLHQLAGLPDDRVIELHGTAHWVTCLGCGRRYTRPDIQVRLERDDLPPACDQCGGILKSATISFGEAMPIVETREAERRSHDADLFLVIGSSLVVYPAAQMPLFALESGGKLVILNATDTPLDNHAELLISAKAAEFMPLVVEEVGKSAAGPDRVG